MIDDIEHLINDNINYAAFQHYAFVIDICSLVLHFVKIFCNDPFLACWFRPWKGRPSLTSSLDLTSSVDALTLTSSSRFARAYD